MSSVRVDAKRCQSTGYCARIAPTVFRVEGDETAKVLDDHPERDALEAAREAETACPAAAITVEVA